MSPIFLLLCGFQMKDFLANQVFLIQYHSLFFCLYLYICIKKKYKHAFLTAIKLPHHSQKQFNVMEIRSEYPSILSKVTKTLQITLEYYYSHIKLYKTSICLM